MRPLAAASLRRGHRFACHFKPLFLKRGFNRSILGRPSAGTRWLKVAGLAVLASGTFFWAPSSQCDWKHEELRQPVIDNAVAKQIISTGRDQSISFSSNIFESARLVLRVSVLAILWFPIGLAWLLPRALLSSGYVYKMVVWGLKTSGPAFIKLGQWAATRQDLLDPEFCEALFVLQDTVTEGGGEGQYIKTIDVISHAFPRLRVVGSWKGQKQFDINQGEKQAILVLGEAIGSGCMATVHKGLLFEEDNKTEGVCEGQRVAIKVLHKGVKDAIEFDLNLICSVASTIHKMCPILGIKGIKWLSLPESADRFAILMKQQSDLRVEAANYEAFSSNGPWKRAIFPKALKPWVCSDVLVETFEDGRRLVDFMTSGSDAQGKPGAVSSATGKTWNKINGQSWQSSKRKISELGQDAFLKMMVEDNFVHADLHPGNILVRYSLISKGAKSNPVEISTTNHDWLWNKHSNDATSLPVHNSNYDIDLNSISLVFLDAGLVSSLTPKDRRNFLSVFAALVACNGRAAARLMAEQADECECQDIIAFQEDVEELVNKIPQASVGLLGFGPLLRRVLFLARHHRVRLESNFVGLLLAIGVMEGIGRQLDPSIQLFARAAPYLVASSEVRGIASEVGVSFSEIARQWM